MKKNVLSFLLVAVIALSCCVAFADETNNGRYSEDYSSGEEFEIVGDGYLAIDVNTFPDAAFRAYLEKY